MRNDLECLECGASVHASCDCGVAYAPKGTRALKAVQAHPEKSDRAIAEELGVSNQTIRRARKQLGHDVTVGRIGRDGRKRRMPKRLPPEPIEAAIQFEEGPVAWRNRARNAAEMADYAPMETCPATKAMLKSVKHVIKKWTTLQQTLERRMADGPPKETRPDVFHQVRPARLVS